ncbi:phosphate ABC transporter substrate-binding protein [Alginatibacterium sediminis]|uniref:Phosphate ABC transporter substrate-binding protein n=1 Tax=Alginatibacterium sediminis TaxID=2164068 RepID=A0A420EH37_9ALTE|nr:substrate-binding domain-containing protein [Alginatibacterium sediminis]RKF19980.1 phosphate ABC transporter substrate-binding protein [Alginatibacterium sediminis]
MILIFQIPKQSHKFLLQGIVLFIALLLSLATQAQTIKIGGTGNALGTMKLIASAYNKSYDTNKVQVLPSIGSSGAIKAIPKGAIEIGLSARPLKETELGKGMIAIEYARTPTIIAVSNASNIDGITTKQLVDIYTGTTLNWEDGSLVRPIIRQAGDDNTVQLKALSPALKQAVELAEEREGLLFASTDQETVNKIENTPGSFGVTSLALLLSENRTLKALTLDGVTPSPETIDSGLYPLVKRFYLILPETLSPNVQHVVDFIRSEKGAAILIQNGNLVL